MLKHARVRNIEYIHPELAIFQIAPDGWQLSPFRSGQYVVLALPGEAPRCVGSIPEEPSEEPGKMIQRAYSIASAGSNTAYLEFYINLVPSGALTPRLFALQPGDDVFLGSKITGMFTIDEVPAERNLLFIATGTGLAPYMSMIRTHLLANPERRLCILHGARHYWELGYRAQLMHLQSFVENFSYHTIISRPKEEAEHWPGPQGHVNDLIDRGLVTQSWGRPYSPEDTSIFLCGNPAMIDDMIQRLTGEGFTLHSKKTPGNLHTEKYW